MIVNQMGGGSGGEVWKHYRYANFYEYNTSGGTKNSFDVKGNISQYNMSGYIFFDDSSGRELAIGHFSTGTRNSTTNASDTIYTNKSASSGSSAASCGFFNVSNVAYGLSIAISSSANSYAYGNASRVVVVADVFYQEG